MLSVNSTVLCSQVVMAVPLQVLVIVTGLPIHCSCMTSIRSGITKVSRKSMDPSGHVASTVNWMNGYMEFICSMNLSLSAVFCTINVSSTYLLHYFGGWSVVFIALISESSM